MTSSTELKQQVKDLQSSCCLAEQLITKYRNDASKAQQDVAIIQQERAAWKQERLLLMQEHNVKEMELESQLQQAGTANNSQATMVAELRQRLQVAETEMLRYTHNLEQEKETLAGQARALEQYAGEQHERQLLQEQQASALVLSQEQRHEQDISNMKLLHDQAAKRQMEQMGQLEQQLATEREAKEQLLTQIGGLGLKQQQQQETLQQYQQHAADLSGVVAALQDQAEQQQSERLRLIATLEQAELRHQRMQQQAEVCQQKIAGLELQLKDAVIREQHEKKERREAEQASLVAENGQRDLQDQLDGDRKRHADVMRANREVVQKKEEALVRVVQQLQQSSRAQEREIYSLRAQAQQRVERAAAVGQARHGSTQLTNERGVWDIHGRRRRKNGIGQAADGEEARAGEGASTDVGLCGVLGYEKQRTSMPALRVDLVPGGTPSASSFARVEIGGLLASVRSKIARARASGATVDPVLINYQADLESTLSQLDQLRL